MIEDKKIDKNFLLFPINSYQQSLLYISNSININKIGIVDFRYILKKSNAIKVLGNKFVTFEKKINEKIKFKQSKLKLKEIKIISFSNSKKI